jgi:hypothetical protein
VASVGEGVADNQVEEIREGVACEGATVTTALLLRKSVEEGEVVGLTAVG